GNAGRLERAVGAIATLDAAVVGARTTDLIAAKRDAIHMTAPDASMLRAGAAAMGDTLKQVDKLYKTATKSFYDGNREVIDKGMGRDALHAAWNSFSFIYTLWFEAGGLDEKMDKAKHAGVLQVTATAVD